jgi:uncharacterized protein YdaU (DUF1376 family)
MSTKPYMQFYTLDYLADTEHLTTVEHGAYLLLIFNYWQSRRAFLAKNERTLNERLANVVRMSNEEFQNIKETLLEFFTFNQSEDGSVSWSHKRIDRDLLIFDEKSEKAKKAGKASAERRAAHSDHADYSTDVKRTFNECSTDVKRTFNECSTITDNRQQITDSIKEKLKQKENSAPSPDRKRSRKTKEVLPEPPDWIPEDHWLSFVDFRKKIKSPLTAHAAELAFRTLEKLKNDGDDPGEVLNQSILNGWKGLFPMNQPKRGWHGKQSIIHVATPEELAKAPNDLDNFEYINGEWVEVKGKTDEKNQ